MIDAHQHFWDPSRREYPWLPETLRRPFGPDDLRACGVTGSVLVQTLPDYDETREFLALETEVVLGVVGWVDLTSPAVGDDLDALLEGPGRLVGIRHQVHDEPDPAWLCREDVRRGLRAVAERDLVYDLLVRPRELPAAISTVAALPELRFVLDHIAKPRIADGRDDEWARSMPALAAHPNVDVKLSGMVTEAGASWTPDDLRPFVHAVLEWFGAERAMFGSDWPVCLLAASYGDVVAALEAALSGSEASRVWSDNATRAYRL